MVYSSSGGTTGGTATPPATGGGPTPPSNDGTKGVVDFGNGEDIKPKQPVTTAEATDPTQVAINLVKQRRKEQAQQAPPTPSTGNAAHDFMNY